MCVSVCVCVCVSVCVCVCMCEDVSVCGWGGALGGASTTRIRSYLIPR